MRQKNYEKGAMPVYMRITVNGIPKDITQNGNVKMHAGGLMAGMSGKKGLARLKNYVKYMGEHVKYSNKLDVKEITYLTTVFLSPGVLTKMKK